MKKRIITIIILSLIYTSSSALACPCLILELDGEEQAKAIFTGKVTEIEEVIDGYQKTTFRVYKFWKELTEGNISVISETTKNTGCYAQFQVGDEFLVYTYENEYWDWSANKKYIAEHYTNTCSRENMVKERRINKNINKLEKMGKPTKVLLKE